MNNNEAISNFINDALSTSNIEIIEISQNKISNPEPVFLVPNSLSVDSI